MADDVSFSTALQQSQNQAIADQHEKISQDAQLDMTDPENLMQMKYDMDNYSTMMQTQLGIEDALQSLRKAIAQSIGQA